VLQAVLILPAISLGNISALSAHMQREEFRGAYFMEAPFEGFGFALPAPRRAVQKERMPFLAAATLLAVRAVKGARFANGG